MRHLRECAVYNTNDGKEQDMGTGSYQDDLFFCVGLLPILQCRIPGAPVSYSHSVERWGAWLRIGDFGGGCLFQSIVR